MSEVSAEVQPPQTTEKKTSETTKTQKPEEKSFFQEILSRFNEGIKRLWGKTDEKLEPVNKKAEGISENTKTDSIKNYFKIQIENFKDSIQAGVYDIYGVFYDIGAGVSRARKAIPHLLFDESILATYLSGKPGEAEKLKGKAKEWHEKAKAKIREIRERRDKLHKGANEIREQGNNL